MTSSNPYAFPLKPEEYAPGPVPSINEWRQLWKVWDLVTTQMISPDALMEQPIPLRNPLLFYLGHIPTFEDIHLTRATGEKPTEPAYYHTLFERGIDPDVDDPTICHEHSELPDVFPPVSETLDYREKVKIRIQNLYTTRQPYEERCVGRALWIGFEHEALHIETFLYMTILSPNVRPPPEIPRPDFAALASKAASERVENSWFRIPAQHFTIGYEDPESDDPSLPDRFFAWDNEREPYDVEVPSFDAQGRPVSNGEYAAYLVDVGDSGRSDIPVTWTALSSPDDPAAAVQTASRRSNDGRKNGCIFNSGLTNGDEAARVADKKGKQDELAAFVARHGVRTVWGLIPLSHALDWPLTASYNEVSAYAAWAGNGVRIPTLHEVRSIHHYAERLKKEEEEEVSGGGGGGGDDENRGQKPAASDAVNNINKTMHNDPRAIFADLAGSNSGFRNFHPAAVTTQSGGGSLRLRGLGDMGGAGEWTSSLFAPQPGFRAMDIYPGYSGEQDFMDGKHVAIVGGSWALHPRVAGRKSFLNWWQKNYLYPWVAIRLVRDI